MANVKFGEWHNITELPTKDGDYIVLRFWRGNECFSVTSLHYTVEYGWNTFVDHPDNAVDYADNLAEGHIVLWAELPVLEKEAN